jgi:hypothetical protein
MKNVIELSKDIAAKANECCNRSDGYEEEIAALALKHLQTAYEWGYASAQAEAPHREDMGR